jgi:hypothetical protein
MLRFRSMASRRAARLAPLVLLFCLGGALLAQPAQAAVTTETKTLSCEKKFQYGHPSGFPAVYKAAAKFTVTRDNGRLVSIGWPTITQDGMTQGAGITEYVTVVAYKAGNTVYLNAAGYTSYGNWVSCSASKTVT